MSRRCPECGREWGRDPAWCGACGAPLGDQAAPPPTTSPRWRRLALAVPALALVLLATVVALPGGDEAPTGDADARDPVTLPEPPQAAPPPTGPPTCTRQGLPVDCIAWDVDTGRDVSLGPRLPGSGVLVTVDAEGLVVREPDSGDVRWSQPDLDGGRAQGVVAGVLVLTTPGGVTGVDVEDGTRLWTREGLQAVGPLSEPGAPVVVLGRRPSSDAAVTTMVGLDPRTGDLQWEWTTPWEAGVGSAVQPVGPDGVLATGGARLAHLDIRTGRTLWEVRTVSDAYLQVQPSGHVSAQQLATADAPQLWIHDGATGEVLLRMPAVRVASHVVADGVVVVHAPAEGVLRGMDLATGDPRWQVLLGGVGALGFPLPSAEAGAVVVLEREQRRVRRLDARTGDIRWETRLAPSRSSDGAGTFFGQPMLVEDLVVVEDTSSVITVLDVETGREHVTVAGGSQLDVRSLQPLTLVLGSRWMGVALPDAGPSPAQ